MATKRIAVIATIYRYLSHAQHFADRFFVGYPYGGKWNRPDCQLVSIYVDRKPEGDQSEDRAREFGGKVYPTIAVFCVKAYPKIFDFIARTGNQ